MNIVVIDRENLPMEVEFPFLEAAKYGWVERAELSDEELAEVAWRSHVLVTTSKVITAMVIEKLPLLKMVAIVGDCADKNCNLVDFEAIDARDIEVSHVPGGRVDSSADAEACMAQTIRNIDAMIAGAPINLL